MAPQERCYTHGITDSTKVFHSFRHSFIDALCLAGVAGEINIALVGHTDPSVNDKYGAKDKAIRFRHRLAEAVASMAYAGLDPSHLTKQRATHDHQRTPTAERAALAASGDHPGSGYMEKLVADEHSRKRDTMAFFGAHDKPLQLVLKSKDAYLVRDAIGVVRPSVLANATPNEIFQ